MSPSGPSGDSRVTVAPPAVGGPKSRRAGYIALAASGLITATAFAGIADLAGTSLIGGPPTAGIQRFDRQPNGAPDGGLVAGEASPDQTTIKISGAAHGTDRRTTTTTPTTSTSGHPTTRTTSSPDDDTSTPGNPGTSPPGTSTTSTKTTTTTTTPPTTTTTTTTPACDPEVEECPPDGGGDGGGGGSSTTSSSTSETTTTTQNDGRP